MEGPTANGRLNPASAIAASESREGGASPSQAPQPAPMPTGNAPPPFLVKTYDMVDDPSTNNIVSWSSTNNSFVVWDPPEFGRNLLPKYFKHNNFSSFVRQLNTYGFRKVDPDRWEFANEGFLRGQKHLLKTISRRKPAHGHVQQQQQLHGQSTSVSACVEVGKFGLEEEVARLRRDKNVLMQELVRLRQQQQATDSQLQTVVQRLQGMEQRQQQMMSFLAKAVNSPGFLAQFVQQQNDSSRRITEGSKKRRLKQDDLSNDQSVVSTDGQIVKYQPLINEAAKSMLRQLMKLDPSPGLDNIINNSDSYLIRDGSASNATDCGNSANHISGVTLQEVPPTSGHSPLPSTPAVAAQSSANFTSDMQSPLFCATSDLTTGELSHMNSLGGVQNMPHVDLVPDLVMPQLSQLPGISPEDDVDILDTEPENGAFLDSLDVNEKLSLDTDDLPTDTQIDWDRTLLEDMEDLPGSIDPFWEKFLQSPSQNEEMDSSRDDLSEGILMKPQVNGWDKAQHLEHITAQMGNLSSDAENV